MPTDSPFLSRHFAQFSPFSTRKRVLSALGVLLVLGSGAAYLALSGASAKSTDDSKATQTPVVLEFAGNDIALVVQQPLAKTIAISGSLMPVTQATVKSTVAGEIRKVLVREGDVVREGAVIAEVDTVDARSRLAAAQADLEERKTRLAIAARNKDTNQALLKQNFISQNAFDQLHSTFEGSEAAVKWAEAQVQLARKAVDDAVIRAPISGVVSKQFVHAGERVGPDGPVMGIVDLSRFELEATVPASDVPSLSMGQAVRFQVDGFGTRPFQGHIERINPVAEAGSRAIKIFVSVRNVDGSLRGGMFAQGQVMLAQSRGVPAIPVSALFEEAGQTYVFAVADGKLSKRAVSVGLRDDTSGLVEASTGLKVGEAVVRVRMNGLKDGAPATLLPGATAAPAAKLPA